MASDPLRAIGVWRAQEGAIESGVPLAVVICAPSLRVLLKKGDPKAMELYLVS